jgi:hypothetical protein
MPYSYCLAAIATSLLTQAASGLCNTVFDQRYQMMCWQFSIDTRINRADETDPASHPGYGLTVERMGVYLLDFTVVTQRNLRSFPSRIWHMHGMQMAYNAES